MNSKTNSSPTVSRAATPGCNHRPILRHNDKTKPTTTGNSQTMTTRLYRYSLPLFVPLLASGAWPELPSVSAAMRKAVENGDISGAVTVVVTKDKVVHCDATGLADIARKEPMTPDSLFWIASMTKPVTAVAVLMLQDEGKLKVTDPVAKYIPEFAGLRTPSGQPANLTIAQMLTHTSGLGEAPREAAAKAQTLADLIPLFLAAPMQYEPGAKWSYTQSGINVASRIVEIVSGLPFDVFVQKRILDPLGMNNTTFYPTQKPAAHQVVAYRKNPTTGTLEAAAATQRLRCRRPSAPGQRRPFLHWPRLRAFLPDAAGRRIVGRQALSQPRGDEAVDDGPDRRPAHRLFPVG